MNLELSSILFYFYEILTCRNNGLYNLVKDLGLAYTMLSYIILKYSLLIFKIPFFFLIHV